MQCRFQTPGNLLVDDHNVTGCSHSEICRFVQLAQLKEAEGAVDGEAADEIANLRYHTQLGP